MKPKQVIIILGDLIALLAFVYVGQATHGLVDPVNPVLGVLRSSWIFVLVWLGTGWLIGAFLADDKYYTWVSLLAKPLNAWLVTSLISLVIRSYWLGHPAIPTSFIIATVGFGLLFLWTWRIPLWLFLLWRGKRNDGEKVRVSSKLGCGP